jgi:hypothetical protein
MVINERLIYDDKPVWEKQSKEPHIWFMRFDLYRQCGYTRSLRKVWALEQALKEDGVKSILGNATLTHAALIEIAETEKAWDVTSTPETSRWGKYCKKWEWKERAEAWDLHASAIAENENRKRIEESRNRMYDIYANMIGRVDDMLSHPLTARKVSEDGKTIVIMPVKWTQSDVPRYLDAAMKLVKYSTGQDAVKLEEGETIQQRAIEAQEALKAQSAEAATVEMTDEELLSYIIEKTGKQGAVKGG